VRQVPSATARSVARPPADTASQPIDGQVNEIALRTTVVPSDAVRDSSQSAGVVSEPRSSQRRPVTPTSTTGARSAASASSAAAARGAPATQPTATASSAASVAATTRAVAVRAGAGRASARG